MRAERRLASRTHQRSPSASGISGSTNGVGSSATRERDRVREPDDLEQAGRTGGVDGDPVRAVDGQVVAAQHALDALEVALERPALVVVELGLLDPVRRVGEHRRDRGGAGRRRRELRGIEVEEDGEDAAVRRADLGEPAQAPSGERLDGHGCDVTLPGGGANGYQPSVPGAPLNGPTRSAVIQPP